MEKVYVTAEYPYKYPPCLGVDLDRDVQHALVGAALEPGAYTRSH